MSFSAGDTFVNQYAPNTPAHLWAVISDTRQSVDELESKRLITRNKTLNSNILAGIRQGAMVSPFAILKIRKILENQNLI